MTYCCLKGKRKANKGVQRADRQSGQRRFPLTCPASALRATASLFHFSRCFGGFALFDVGWRLGGGVCSAVFRRLRLQKVPLFGALDFKGLREALRRQVVINDLVDFVVGQVKYVVRRVDDFLGRDDHEARVGAWRFLAGEIEATVAALGAADEVHVVSALAAHRHQRFVAVVIPRVHFLADVLEGRAEGAFAEQRLRRFDARARRNHS